MRVPAQKLWHYGISGHGRIFPRSVPVRVAGKRLRVSIGRLSTKGASCVPSELRDAVLIVNPLAGGGRRVPQIDEARRIFRNAGIETELKNTASPGEATDMARLAVE